MRVPSLPVSILALSLSLPALAGPTSRRSFSPPERPLNLDVSGAYQSSPVAIIFRDAAFGALGGAVLVGGVGAASDSGHWGRDAVIGAGLGMILGAIIGGFEPPSEPRISIHADVDRLREGTSALGSASMRFGQHF